MIDVRQAQRIILGSVGRLNEEYCELILSLNRVINEDVYTDIDLPPFDSAAMDGYAVIASDTSGVSKERPAILEVIERIPAGLIPSKRVIQGKASLIMTGGVLPEGANAVVMVEDTERFQAEEEKVKIFREVKEDENIRKRGEDVKREGLIIKKGTVLRPAEIGMLASIGKRRIKTIRPAIVAIIATGSELVEPNIKPSLGKIYNSNTYSLMAQVIEAGGIPFNLGIVPDDEEALIEAFKRALRADLVITSAGVSIGEYDLIKDTLSKMGMRILFSKVAIKPGKPTIFGLIEERPYLGLPGYPVSSMVTFELFARPLILSMMGRRDPFRPTVKAIVLEDIKKKPDRINYLRASIKYNHISMRYEAALIGPHGSGILSSMVKANGLVIVPKEASLIKAGSELEAMILKRE